jgi:hypothetical protein
MSDDLVKFSVPAAFVVSRVRLEPGELAYGYAHGWLDEASTVGVAEGLVAAGAASAPIEELASLFKSDLWRVQQVVDEIESDPDAEPERVWLYLALAWLHDHKDQYADPLQIIEMLYSDFGYPTDIEGLVRFMPPPPGSPTGVEAIEARWSEYLQRRLDEYATRR